MMRSVIKTIDKQFEIKNKVKDSIFIGKCYPIESKSDFENIHSILKKEYYDATHICYGYKLYDGAEKYSDAGEPSGTAGIRILNAINHFELTNIFVSVIRYFGGTKLGIGPLGKAYYQTTFDLLSSVNVIEKTVAQKVLILFTFEDSKFIYKILNDFNAQIISTDYKDKIQITFFISIDFIDELKKLFEENYKSNIELILKDDLYFI